MSSRRAAVFLTATLVSCLSACDTREVVDVTVQRSPTPNTEAVVGGPAAPGDGISFSVPSDVLIDEFLLFQCSQDCIPSRCTLLGVPNEEDVALWETAPFFPEVEDPSGPYPLVGTAGPIQYGVTPPGFVRLGSAAPQLVEGPTYIAQITGFRPQDDDKDLVSGCIMFTVVDGEPVPIK